MSTDTEYESSAKITNDGRYIHTTNGNYVCTAGNMFFLIYVQHQFGSYNQRKKTRKLIDQKNEIVNGKRRAITRGIHIIILYILAQTPEHRVRPRTYSLGYTYGRVYIWRDNYLKDMCCNILSGFVSIQFSITLIFGATPVYRVKPSYCFSKEHEEQT